MTDFNKQQRQALTGSLCQHEGSVEHDELQVDVDRFEILPTGTCTACGLRVKVWEEGSTWGYEEFDDE